MRKQTSWLIVLSGALGLGCVPDAVPVPRDELAPDEPSAEVSEAVRVPDPVQQLIGIQLEAAKYRRCPTLLRAMGKIVAPRPGTAIVSHAFPARVAEIRVEVGDWVKRGQDVVVLESKEVGEAKADFYKAIASCELAKLNFAREERLLKEGIGVKKSFAAAEAEYKVAQTNLEVAEKKLHLLGFTEEHVKQIASTHQLNPTITLYAPIEGKVVDIKAVRGAMVDAATEILTIMDPRVLWVDAEIYEKDIARIRPGQQADIRVPAYPDKLFTGRVSRVSDLVHPDTRTITVRAELPNQEQLLKPGMFADVDLVLDEGPRVLVVPSAAVLEDGSQKIVFVKDQEQFVRRQIATGAVFRNCHQVLSGLSPGELVVVQGNHQLKSKLQEGALRAAHVH